MAWTLHKREKYSKYFRPLRISGKTLTISKAIVDELNIREKHFVKIFYDKEKMLVGLKFSEQADKYSRKIAFSNRYACKGNLTIFTLLKALELPSDIKKELDYKIDNHMIVFSYKELLDNNQVETGE